MSRFLYGVTRQYTESFDVYGDKLSFEWHQMGDEEPILHTGGEDAKRVQIPDFAHRLPEGIRRYTTKGVYDESGNVHLSFKQGSGHGGSHPHLVHEFVMALAENRDPFPNAVQSANWTCVGILAHESAMKGGEIIKLPAFTLS